MTQQLLVGAAEVDITPPAGTLLAGNLEPRPSVGIDDPLTFKAVVLESGGVKLVYVLADLLALQRAEGEALVARAAARTGIPATNIVWAASHTHTGPYVWPGSPATNQEWLNGLPDKFAAAVELAHASRRPARLCLERGYYTAMTHNRRLKFKDGREINTWLLQGSEADVQCLGSAAPIDPEVGILSFDDEAGVPIAILWHYTLHTNTNFGPRFSADYPGVVTGRLRQRFGPRTVPIFMPGAFGDINGAVPDFVPGRAHRTIGNHLADVILERLAHRQPRPCDPVLGAVKCEVVVPYRDFTADQEERIQASQGRRRMWRSFGRKWRRSARRGSGKNGRLFRRGGLGTSDSPVYRANCLWSGG